MLPPDASLLPDVVDLSSNDYLGIAGDVELRTSFFAEAALNGLAMTSSASRLLAGNQNEYYLLEDMLGRLYGGCALLFNSGYHANVDNRTVIHTLVCPSPAIMEIVCDMRYFKSSSPITYGGMKYTFRPNGLTHIPRSTHCR